MTSLFKKIILLTPWFCIVFINCLHYEEQERNQFTPEAQVFVDRILKENKTSKYKVNIIDYSGADGLTSPIGYTIVIDVKKIAILTSSIDSLRSYGIYQYYKYGGGTGNGLVDLKFMGIGFKSDTLDSIQIITDSIINVPALWFSNCNLTHLPSEIGKLRTQKLDVKDNNLTDLPLEIMHLLDPPKYYAYTEIYMSGQKNFQFDSLPDTLKNWFNNVYSKQNFPKN